MASAEASTLSEEQVTELLERLGFEVPKDLAGLTCGEIAEILRPHGAADVGLIEQLRRQGLRRAMKRDYEGASLSRIMPLCFQHKSWQLCFCWQRTALDSDSAYARLM